MTQLDANLEAVRAELRECRRIAVFDHKDGKRLDSFELYAARSGIVTLHTMRKGGELELFNVYGELGRDNKMDTLLAQVRTMVGMRFTSEAAARSEYDRVKPKDRFPEGCADEARKAEKDGELWLAVAWWVAAQAVTAGHSRSAMYEREEYRVRDLIEEKYTSL